MKLDPRHAWLPVALFLAACSSPISQHVEDPAAGINGGFEHAQSGLPVNWIVYSPTTVDAGRYELLLDRTDFREGEQSLRFLVHSCSPAGGWHSPGITQEYPAEPGTTCALTFWVKNEGCDWAVSIGGVTATTGEYEVLAGAGVAQGSWQRVVRRYTLPPGYERLRFELSITSPGSLWIDDVRIRRVLDASG